jgi:sortase B
MGKKKGRLPLIVLLIFFIGLIGYANYRIYLTLAEYHEADEAYEKLAGFVITDNSPEDKTPDFRRLVSGITEKDAYVYVNKSTVLEPIYIPDLTVDFEALGQINEAATAWLYCPDTVIDYPVMAAEDYTYYLHHLPDGTENKNGSLFLDYNCEPDYSGDLSVIYGHCMKTGSMFGTLSRYKKQSYFDEHPYLYLYTKEQNYRIALIYGAVVPAKTWIENDYIFDRDALLEYAKENTTFTSPVKYSEEDRLIVLSTCSYEYTDARYFVLGVLQPQQ